MQYETASFVMEIRPGLRIIVNINGSANSQQVVPPEYVATVGTLLSRIARTVARLTVTPVLPEESA